MRSWRNPIHLGRRITTVGVVCSGVARALFAADRIVPPVLRAVALTKHSRPCGKNAEHSIVSIALGQPTLVDWRIRVA